jgi:CAAX prenyl protease-like protein
LHRHPAFPYIAPFALFMILLAVDKYLPGGPAIWYPARIVAVCALLLTVSRHLVSWWACHWTGSIGVGVLVFAIWIAPDVLFPGDRQHWLFQNGITGQLRQIAEPLRTDVLFLAFRTFGCAVAVPILEEIFWRGWLSRWLIDPDFSKVSLGAFTPFSYFGGSLLFAAEHGPYWEVGLLAGLIYNAWLIRTRSLADCIVAHAVTNFLLSVYVLRTGQWQYWM